MRALCKTAHGEKTQYTERIDAPDHEYRKLDCNRAQKLGWGKVVLDGRYNVWPSIFLLVY